MYEVDDEDFASYNGKGGGENWKWYEPSAFHVELQKLSVDLKTCTERECFIALRNTSAVVGSYSEEYRKGLLQHAGPQCYPQLMCTAGGLCGSPNNWLPMHL